MAGAAYFAARKTLTTFVRRVARNSSSLMSVKSLLCPTIPLFDCKVSLSFDEVFKYKRS